MNFTTNQKKAIESDGKNLLVSASAGTGKTTVMIERIIRLVETKKVSVDEIVVVTFTIAAANQMKEKLRKSLNEKANEPYIYEQLEKIDSCAISTLHSFCSDILREYFYAADIDPAYTVLDPVIAQGLVDKTMDAVFADYYIDDDEIFGKLTDIFHQKRTDESLKKIVGQIYELSRCVENFFDIYESTRKNYLDFGKDNIFEKTLNQNIVAQANAYAKYFEQKSVYAKNIGAQKLAEYLSEHSSYYHLTEQNSLESNYERLSENFDIPFNKKTFLAENLKISPDEFEVEINEIENVRKKTNDWRKKSVEQFNEIGYEKLIQNTKETLPMTDKLIELAKKFDLAYSKAKKEKGVLDFSDMERYALTVLSDEKIQAELKERYKYIFVDEYQDINSVQEAIISKLCGESNLFLVGDVKQSIYGFRETNPDIFVDKISKYVDKNDSLVINLNDNFRSDKNILDYINQVFSVIMTDGFGKVDYAKDALLKGENSVLSNIPSVSFETVEIMPNKAKPDKKYDITDSEQIDDKKSLVAEAIANRIKKLIGTTYIVNNETKNISYGDIAILSRDMKDEAKAIYDTLKSHDIPVSAVFDGEIMTKECLDVVNFLRVIDNPLDDIYVCGVALSHFGGFCEQELSEIKIYSKEKVFIDNFKKYVANNTNTLADKAKVFLTFIDKYREYSYSLTVEELAQKLVTDETVFCGQSYLVYIKGLGNGAIRYEKLTNLLSSLKDKSYSASIDKYLRYLDEGKTAPVSTPDFTDSVTLTTIHKSKGLEYPIVISPNLDKSFYTEAKTVQIDRNMGLGMKFYDFSSKTVYPTLSHMAIDAKKRRKEKEEKMRLLYVLLTRAKYSLILIDCGKGVKPLAAEMGDSFSDWLACANDEKKAIIDDDFSTMAAATETISPQSKDTNFVINSFGYRYGYAQATQTPLKVSASKIRNETEEETAETPYTKELFITDDETADKDSAFIGSAYHRVFESLTLDESVTQIKEKINELTIKGEFSESVAEKISAKKIFEGINNQELKKLLDGETYHEIPFMLKVPYKEVASQYDGNEETVLQGVIDMLVLGKNGVKIIDYKYTSRPEYIVKNYSPQLNAYKLAAEKIFGLKAEAYVLSIKDNNLIKIK